MPLGAALAGAAAVMLWGRRDATVVRVRRCGACWMRTYGCIAVISRRRVCIHRLRMCWPAFVSCDDDMTLRGRVSVLAGPAYIALLLPWNTAGGADSAVGDGAVTSSSAFPSCAAWLDVTSGDESVGVKLRDPCLRAHSECNETTSPGNWAFVGSFMRAQLVVYPRVRVFRSVAGVYRCMHHGPEHDCTDVRCLVTLEELLL